VKFILNTSIDPHFCAIFDDADNCLDVRTWTDRRRDGAEVWEFLEKYDVTQIDWCGGISGPGGFSSLRAAAGVLNAISFAQKIPVHAVRADAVLREVLGDVPFVLNSFGDAVWLPGDELQRVEVAEVADQQFWVGALPEAKSVVFQHQITMPGWQEKMPGALLSVLQKTAPQSAFHADYEFPPV